MNKYFVYVDDGATAFRLAIPAKNEKAAREAAAGAGEVVAVKDVTAEYPIDADKVNKALAVAGFGVSERAFIRRFLVDSGFAYEE